MNIQQGARFALGHVEVNEGQHKSTVSRGRGDSGKRKKCFTQLRYPSITDREGN